MTQQINSCSHGGALSLRELAIAPRPLWFTASLCCCCCCRCRCRRRRHRHHRHGTSVSSATAGPEDTRCYKKPPSGTHLLHIWGAIGWERCPTRLPLSQQMYRPSQHFPRPLCRSVSVHALFILMYLRTDKGVYKVWLRRQECGAAWSPNTPWQIADSCWCFCGQNSFFILNFFPTM